MKLHKLKQIKQVADAIFWKQQSGISEILSRESEIRQNLRRLDELDDEARFTLNESGETFRQLGADLLWQARQSKMRRDLNTNLAGVMAQKLARLDDVTVAFGRQQAINSLIRKEEHAAQKRWQKALEARLSALE